MTPRVIKFLFALIVLAALKGLYDITAEVTVIFAAPLWQDLKIYMAAGRAMLNGVDLYAELFENKPPGMFLLTAMSLRLAGDQLIVAAVHAVTLLAFPIIGGAIGWRSVRGRSDTSAWVALGAGVLFGLTLAQYSAGRGSSSLQTEVLGSLFGSLYVLVIAAPWKSERMQIGVAGAACFLAALVKEPFGPVLVACALLLLRSKREWITLIVLPWTVAGALMLLLLAVFGWLGSYLAVYLPFMLGDHISSRGSPWLRGLHGERMLGDLLAFSPWLLAVILLLIIGSLLATWKQVDRKQAAIRTAGLIIAAYIASFSVGLGGQYYPHHFLFAIPAYFAIFAACLSTYRSDGRAYFPLIITSVVAVSLSLQLLTHPTSRAYWTGPWIGGPKEQAFRDRAAVFDAMLDSCGYDRYLPYGWELEDLWAYTEHSPFSATFTSFRWSLSHLNERFSNIFIDQLNETKAIVLLPERIAELEADTQKLIWEVFTREPPECAKNFMPLKNARDEEYTVLFRKR